MGYVVIFTLKQVGISSNYFHIFCFLSCYVCYCFCRGQLIIRMFYRILNKYLLFVYFDAKKSRIGLFYILKLLKHEFN